MEDMDRVIEEHRKAIGAKKLHVSLGECATPEGVKGELEKVHALMLEYAALPETIRLKAQIEGLLAKMREITRLCQRTVADILDEPASERELRHSIFSIADMASAVDIEFALSFAADQIARHNVDPAIAQARAEGERAGKIAMRERAATEAASTVAPKSIGRDHGRHHEAGAQHAARRIRALKVEGE